MNFKTTLSSLVVFAMAAGMVLTPASGLARDDDHGKKKGRNNHDNGQRGHNDHDDDCRCSDHFRDRRSDGRYFFQSESDRRQQTKNEWRNIAIASGALSIVGLLKKDSTLTFVGAAGALYSAHRYEEDRKSQNRHNRTRAAFFSRPYFYRDGHRYNRRVVFKNGQKCFQFVRHD